MVSACPRRSPITCGVESSLDPTTFEQYEIYVSAHWQTFFETMDRFVDSSIEDYKSARLRNVKRSTLLKELSALRGFLKWAEQHKFLAAMPVIESPPPKVTGTADKKKPHKTEPVPLDESEVERIIQQLPEFSKRSRWSGPYPVRARFEVAWETGLRPATLDSLIAPLDYQPGRNTRRVRDEADKARDGRELPLSDRARAALDRICPTEGLIFGPHDYRAHLRTAAKAAGLPPEKATKISSYDFRHARVTHFAENAGDNIPGIMYLVGHRHATTTDKYIRRSRRAGEDVLDTIAAKKVIKDAVKRSPDPAFRSHSGLLTVSRPVRMISQKTSKVKKLRKILQCEEGESNPYDFTHWNLNPARLPVPPSSLEDPCSLAQQRTKMDNFCSAHLRQSIASRTDGQRILAKLRSRGWT